MGLDIENGALGAEYEQNKNVKFFFRILRIGITEFRISLRSESGDNRTLFVTTAVSVVTTGLSSSPPL